MTATQINLVQASWAKVVPIADTAADLFYDKLFELDPSLRELFPEEMADQKKKLMRMIGVAVASLRNLDTLVPSVQDLGRRHATYKVEDSHYDTVGSALLWTLGKGLGDAFTEEVESAWAATYNVLATTMKDAAATMTSA
ncbi:MAG: hemin receptor [Phycisphaera sp.]|nr:hemin receptor [Phycisphaera sp.]